MPARAHVCRLSPARTWPKSCVVLGLRLPPRTSADRMIMFMAAAWCMSVSGLIAAFSKMMTHDSSTDLLRLIGR